MTTNDPLLPYQSLPLEKPPEATEPPPGAPHDPYAALRHPNFRRYFVGNAFTVIGVQMAGITVGWELYARTNSAVALGMVGLVQIVPILLFALPAGHLVDRFNRRNMILFATGLLSLTYILLGISSRWAINLPHYPFIAGINHALAAIAHAFGDPNPEFNNPHIPFLFLILFINGCIRAVNQPARQAIVPALVPVEHLSNAITWNSSLFETCNMVGPSLAGVGIAILLGGNAANPWAYAVIYWITAGCQMVQFFNMWRIRIPTGNFPREPMTFRSLMAGVHFVANNEIILSIITLDLFAVLLGGATALLPVFAKDILHVGPAGLGFLRAAPSVGAITMALLLAHLPPMKNAGRNMLIAVAGFGVATIVFGLSRNFWLSIIALVVTGFCDNISVVVRQTLVQILTPDAMRGRVSAVNSVFISTSNELGEFESGVTAALGIRVTGSPIFGPMLAVAAGGVGTVLVVTGVTLLWPKVLTVKRLTEGGT